MSADNTRHRVDRDELLERVNLPALLDSLTPSEGQGHRRRWRCPDPTHPDEHPSVTVTHDRFGIERWRCWSGGHGGTAIDAVIAAKQLGIGESMRWLSDHHAHLQPIPFEATPTRTRPVGKPSREVIEYVERSEKLLRTRAGTEIRSWLLERGLDDEVLTANRVGADPGRRFLPRPTGLPSGWPAAIYPALDPSGNVTYFQARFLNPDKAGQKYDNPARLLATNPRLAWAQPVSPQNPNGLLIVTEGIPDALIASSAGMRSVGVLGSAAPNHHVADQLTKAFSRYDQHSPSVVICFDADRAGRFGAALLTELLQERGIRTANVAPPDGMDITDWASASSHWTDQLLDTAVARIDTDLTLSTHDCEMDVDFGP